jgi:chitinase
MKPASPPSRKSPRKPAIARLLAVMAALAVLAAAGCQTNGTTNGTTPLSKVVIGYYPSWGRTPVDHTRLVYKNLTHIANAFAWPDASGNLVVPSDYLYPELNAEAHRNGVMMIMSLGGWGNCAGFPGMSSTSANRSRFIGQVVAFSKANAYDGVDIDWEFVESPAEQADFVSFIQELSAALKAQSPPLLLTMAAPADAYYGQWIDFETLAAKFDFIGFMTYDFHGPWSDHSGHNSPLYADTGDTCGSVDETFRYARSRQVPLGKRLLGVPFYGKSFDCGGLGQPFTTCGGYSYTDAMALRDAGWTRTWDAAARVPWLRRADGGMIVCYDDTQSVGAKCDYVRSKQAAGIIIWELTQDYRNGTSELLAAVGSSFRSR